MIMRYHKLTLTAAFVLALVFIFSCSSNDDGGNDPDGNGEGSIVNADGDAWVLCSSNGSNSKCIGMIFKQNGEQIRMKRENGGDWYVDDIRTYSISGNQITVYDTEGLVVGVIFYSISANTLTIIEKGTEYVFTRTSGVYINGGSSSPSSSSSSVTGSSSSPGGWTGNCTATANTNTHYCSNGTLKQYGSMTDDGGRVYKTVVIGAQTWMAENLNYAEGGGRCGRGSTLINVDETTFCNTYGRFYSWATALDLSDYCDNHNCASDISAKHRGICPDGWHIPSDADWNILMKFVDPSWNCPDNDNECAGFGTKLKANSSLWNSNGKGTDDFGFAALPGGYGSSYGGLHDVNINGGWWSSSEYNAYYAYLLETGYDEYAGYDWGSKSYLRSVRCLKD